MHSPEQKGYAEPHAYPVNLFDNSSDFPRNLQQFVDLLLDAPFVPDIVTLKSWAKQIGMELEQDNSMLVLRDAEGRLSALPAKAGSPLDEASCKAISKLQTMLQLNSEWRKGSISKEAIVKAVYPGASQDDLEIVSIFDNLPYYVSPDTKHAATPYIFSGGGPDCMTLEVLNGPSPQQRITALLKAVPTEAEKTEAHAIAKAAGFQIRFKLASFQMIYPNGVAQELRYGKAFEENTLSQFSLQTGATR